MTRLDILKDITSDIFEKNVWFRYILSVVYGLWILKQATGFIRHLMLSFHWMEMPHRRQAYAVWVEASVAEKSAEVLF